MMFKLSAVDSMRLDALRFPLIVLVIYIHARSATTMVSSDTTALNMLALARLIISDGVARTAVPLFFILSGYFLLLGQRQWSWTTFGQKLARRVQTLLVPYLFWNLLLFGVLAVAQATVLRGFFNGGGILAEMDWAARLRWVLGLQRYPIAYQFWFIRDLILLIILTPALFVVARGVSGAVIGSAMLGFLWITNIWPVAVPAGEALLFFFLGLGAGIHGRDLLAVPPLALLALSYTALLAGVIGLQGTVFADPVQHLLVVVGILLAFAVVRALPQQPLRRLAALAGTSFFVFAVHEPLTTTLLKLSFRLVPVSPAMALIVYLVVPMVVVTVTVLLNGLAVRLAPALTRRVTGR